MVRLAREEDAAIDKVGEDRLQLLRQQLTRRGEDGVCEGHGCRLSQRDATLRQGSSRIGHPFACRLRQQPSYMDGCRI